MFPLVLRYGGVGNPKSSEVLQQIFQIRWVGIPVLSTIWLKIIKFEWIMDLNHMKCYVGLHMDVIPCDTVVPAGCDTTTHSEHQPLSPGQVNSVQGLLPLYSVCQQTI